MAPRYKTTDLLYKDEVWSVEMMTGVYLLKPEEGGPGLIFINKDGTPTHVAIWTNEVARSILAELNMIIQNLPI